MPANKCACCGRFASELTDTNDGEVCATCLNDSYKQCYKCEQYFINGTAEIDDKFYCFDCAHDIGYNQCDDCKEWSGELRECGNHDYCYRCADENHYHPCHHCSELLHERDLEYSDISEDWFCNDCFHDTYTTCEGCGAEIYQDDANDGYCSDCYRHRDEWEPRRHSSKTGRYDKVGSERCFGVEIETAECDNSNSFSNNHTWGCKEDGSISGMEFYSSILCGNEGLEAIDDICSYARRNDWNVDECCGLHIHMDMRYEAKDSLFSISAAFRLLQEVFQGLVEDNRLENSYCKGCPWNLADLQEYKESSAFTSFTNRFDRYYWFNIASYIYHQTFEIRLHHGTIKAEEIKNWIKACLTLADWASNHTLQCVIDTLQSLTVEEKFAKCCEIWESKGCSDLIEYYSKKARKYKSFNPMKLVLA